jgi:serine phosphatase RsbU (regulator of sigma subunit)
MASLVIYTPDGKKHTVILQAALITLGRSRDADLSYPDDSGLSRLHLQFKKSGDGYLIQDLNSKNGTSVNGQRLEAARPLVANDKISCGHLAVVYDAGRSAPQIEFVEPSTASGSEAAIVTTLGGVLHESTTGAAASMSALIQAGNELAIERPLEQLFPIILGLAIGAVGASRGLLMTVENGKLVERASRGDLFKISTAVRDRVLEQKQSVLVRDTRLDDAYRNRESLILDKVQTLMAVPLQVREDVRGIIYVDSPSVQREFTREDLKVLTVLANIAAIRVEHARLALVEQARRLMERELEQAEAIQRNALPAAAPAVSGLDLAGRNVASRAISGDYFDYFTGEDGLVALLLADVSGKGLAAALMVMALQARVQPLFEQLPTGPEALKSAIERLNRLTTANCPPAKFITLFACVADGKNGHLDWVSAGHNPPLVMRADGSHEFLTHGGPILGLFPNLEFTQYQTPFHDGDVIAIYSDGITEACTPQDEEFNLERLAEVVRKHRTGSADQIADAILAAVREWTAGCAPADDMTVVIARKTGLLKPAKT